MKEEFRARKNQPAIYCNAGDYSFSVVAPDGEEGNKKLITAIKKAREAFWEQYNQEEKP